MAGSSGAFNASLPITGATATFTFSTVPAGGLLSLELALIVGADAPSALALAGTVADAFDAEWDNFANGWQARWADAFTPKPPSGSVGHFSGSVPVLTLDESPVGTAVSRLYYMGVLAILQAERTNLPLVAPRVYVTGTGNELCGISVGGSEQWAWDQVRTARVLRLCHATASLCLSPRCCADILRLAPSAPRPSGDPC